MGSKIFTIQDPYEKSVLTQKCAPVTFPLKPTVLATIQEMQTIMQTKGGAGLSASQIGINQQIMLCSFTRKPEDLTVMLNSSYTNNGSLTQESWEGCYSIPLCFANVTRWQSIKAKYYTPEGKCIEQDFEGVKAKIFSHECDHGDGILMTDRAVQLKQFKSEAEFNAFLAEIRLADKISLEKVRT